MGVFQGVLGLLTLLPYIIGGVEKLHHGKTGAEKKAAVVQLAALGLTAAHAAAPEKVPDPAGALAGISAAVDGVVQVLNGLGLFQHQSAAPAAPAGSGSGSREQQPAPAPAQ